MHTRLCKGMPLFIDALRAEGGWGQEQGKAKFQTDTRPIRHQAVVKKAKTSGLGSTTAEKQHTTQRTEQKPTSH